MTQPKLTIVGENVFLDSPGERNKIGEIHENTFVTHRIRSKHLMRKWNAYGINAQIIDNPAIENVVIVEGDKSYLIPKQRIKAEGRYHREEDLEPQYFIGIDLLSEG
jgi:hypothetical protein